MILKRISLLAIVMMTLIAVSCKKDKTDDSVNGNFQGRWSEASAGAVTLVVTTDPGGNAGTPNLFLNHGGTGYPMIYKFNNSGDTIYLSTSATELNVPYKITFSDSRQSFTIKRFHSTLPAIDPVTFNKMK